MLTANLISSDLHNPDRMQRYRWFAFPFSLSDSSFLLCNQKDTSIHFFRLFLFLCYLRRKNFKFETIINQKQRCDKSDGGVGCQKGLAKTWHFIRWKVYSTRQTTVSRKVGKCEMSGCCDRNTLSSWLCCYQCYLFLLKGIDAEKIRSIIVKFIHSMCVCVWGVFFFLVLFYSLDPSKRWATQWDVRWEESGKSSFVIVKWIVHFLRLQNFVWRATAKSVW
jgi:hypothetical protein